MLISLIAMTALLLAEGLSHFAVGTAEVEVVNAVENPLHKPEDPSTMTLALIGAGTLAVYFGSRRTIRPRRPITLGDNGRPHFDMLPSAAVQPLGKAEEEPSRGAA